MIDDGRLTTSGRDADDPRALAAARNNAEWCDLVCRTHGAATAFHAHAWLTATRSPSAYPDAVTLHRSAAVDDLLTLIDGSTGCSVKDSFASLDLSGSGFEVLFDAEWIYRPATATAGVGALSWKVVETVDELRVWAAAHGGGVVFHPALLHDPAVAVLSATDAAERLAAGVIGNRSRGVIGLSNLFTVSADPDEAWAGAVAALSRVFPGLPLVGYERGEDLAAAHRAGFTGVGQLRVWRNA
jgi:hypothetical protein